MPAKNLQVIAALLPLALILAGPDPLQSHVPYRACRGCRQGGISRSSVQCTSLYQNLLRIRGGDGGGVEGTRSSENLACSSTSGLRKNGQRKNEPYYMHVSDILPYIHESNLPPSPWQTRGNSNNITIKPVLSEADISHTTHKAYENHANATKSAKAQYRPVQYPPLCSEEWKIQEAESIKWRSMPSVVGWFQRCAAVTCVLLVEDTVLVMCKEDDKGGEMWSFPTVYVSSEHACFAHIVAPKLSELLGCQVTMKERMPMSTCASLHTQSIVFECEPGIESRDVRSHVLRRALKSLPEQAEIAWVSPEGIGSLTMDVRNRLVRIGYWQRQAEVERAPTFEKEIMRVHDVAPVYVPARGRNEPSSPLVSDVPGDVSDVTLDVSDVFEVQNGTMLLLREDTTEEDKKAKLNAPIPTGSSLEAGTHGHSAGTPTKKHEQEHTSLSYREKDGKDRGQQNSCEPEKDKREHDACVTATARQNENAQQQQKQQSQAPDRSELWSAARRDQASGNVANQRMGGLDRGASWPAARAPQASDNYNVHQRFDRYGSGQNQKGAGNRGNLAGASSHDSNDTRSKFQKAKSPRGAYLNTGTRDTPRYFQDADTDAPRSPQYNAGTRPKYGQSNTYNSNKKGSATRPQSKSHAATDLTTRDPHAGLIGKLAYLFSVPPHKLCSALTTATQHEHMHSHGSGTDGAAHAHADVVDTSMPEAEAISSGGLLDVVESAVRGRHVATRHLRTPREFIAHGLVRIPADALSFAREPTGASANDSAADSNNRSSTVADYFRSKYTPLRYPGLPCVVSYIQPHANTYIEPQPSGDHGRTPRSKSECAPSQPIIAYYPLEVLELLDDITTDAHTHGFDIEDEYLLGTYDEQGVPSASLRGAWQPCDENPLEGGWVPISAVRLKTGDDGSVQSIEIPRDKECALNQTTWDAWMRERQALNNGRESGGNHAEPSDKDDDDSDLGAQQAGAARDSLWKFVQSQIAKRGEVVKEVPERASSSSLVDSSHVSENDSGLDDSDARVLRQQKRSFKKPHGRAWGKHAAPQVDENTEILCASQINGGRDALRKLWQAQGETAAKGIMPVSGPEIGEDGRLTQQGARMVESMLKRVLQRGVCFEYFCVGSCVIVEHAVHQLCVCV
jgi:hypothetical protein